MINVVWLLFYIMIFKFKKGSHSFGWTKRLWLFVTGFLWKPTQITYKVRFSESCRFDTPKNPDQLNKLFGMSFGILPVYHKGKWYSPHHWNSIRWAWDYNKTTDRIDLYKYFYYAGERIIIDEKQSCEINVRFEFNIDLGIDSGVEYLLGYKLYPFIGGKESAPQDCEIELIEIKP